jgi:NAD(P)-dependent dehydrogenase (short-subunit alcohol dehydrogenase family)
MADPSRFAPGATALVVGAGGGLGAAFVRALRADPAFATVLGTAREPDRVADADGAIALDVLDDDSIDAAARALRTRTDRLDLVLYCPGLLHDEAHGVAPEKRLADLRRDALERVFAVNAFGPVLLARAVADLLPRRERCVWGNLSARVGSIGDDRLGGWYAYRGSKAAQNLFTRNLSIELGRRHRGLLCVALHPGTVATGLSEPFRPAEGRGVVDPDTAADNLLGVLAGLGPEQSGRFYAWDGEEIPW